MTQFCDDHDENECPGCGRRPIDFISVRRVFVALGLAIWAAITIAALLTIFT